MISAPSLLQPLSGSKVVITLLVICGLISCTTSRRVVDKPSTPPPVEEPAEDKVSQYDPKTDEVILVPRDAIQTDTVSWTEDKTPPIITDEKVITPNPTVKDHLEITVLMPFNAANAPLFSEQKDPKLNRFIQYYAGMQMAMDEMGFPLTNVKVNTLDVDDPSTAISLLTSRPELRNADVIVGPYEKEEIDAIATFGLNHEVMVVSPWLPAFATDKENPYFIQLFPGLNAHAQAITTYILEEMPGKKVYVVARDNAVERNRIQLFGRNNGLKTEELIIKDASPDLVNTDLHELLSDDAGTVFILPYFSKSDESFVNAFMRKLHAEKDTREAIVFGLPQWTGFTNLNANYMESLNAHLSISSFIDVASPGYQGFRTGFYSRFHVIPDINAFLGFDLMKWLGERLTAYGQEGLIGQMDTTGYGLASGFDIRPVYKNDTTTPAEIKSPLYYENRRIRILGYKDQDFILVR